LKNSDEEIKKLYDEASKHLAFYYLDLILGRSMENSIYRKKAIATLGLKPNSKVLDVACGMGLNFKIIEKYITNGGMLVGVDISSESLKFAKGKIIKYKWPNVKLVNKSFMDYNPENHFDAVLCTYALEIIPNYKGTIDRIYNLLKPGGRFSMIGMKLSSQMPYKILNPFFKQLYRSGGIDLYRNIIKYLKMKFKKINYYENCYFDYAYILSTSKNR